MRTSYSSSSGGAVSTATLGAPRVHAGAQVEIDVAAFEKGHAPHDHRPAAVESLPRGVLGRRWAKVIAERHNGTSGRYYTRPDQFVAGRKG